MADRTCTRCGVTHDKSKFYFSESKQQYNHWCKQCYKEWHRERYAPASPDAHDEPRPCKSCGEVYTPKQRKVSTFCSRECKEAARCARLKAQRLAAKQPRNCAHCGTPIPPSKFVTATFCGEKCNSAAHQVTRKMRKRAGDPGLDLISRAGIAERDGWRCGICRKKVRPDLEHPNPYCASIDHVLPLARGGDNSPANLQLAHLRCNLSKKADGIIQSRLF